MSRTITTYWEEFLDSFTDQILCEWAVLDTLENYHLWLKEKGVIR